MSFKSSEEERVYSPAGVSQKEKYAILRARQKERLVRRHVVVQASPPPSVKDPQASESTTLIVKQPKPKPQPSNEPISIPDRRPENQPIHNQRQVRNKGKKLLSDLTSYKIASQTKITRTIRQPRHDIREALSQPSSLLVSDRPCCVSKNMLHDHMNNSAPHNSFQSFAAHSPLADPSTIGQQPFEPFGRQCSPFTSLQERLGPSTINLHNSKSNSTGNTARASTLAHVRPPADLFSNEPLQPRQLNKRQIVPDMSINIQAKPHTNIPFRQNPSMPTPHCMLNLGQSLQPLQSMSGYHKKENMLSQAESDANEKLREWLIRDVWSEEELDQLWIGVRRHGHGNWDIMLQDPKLPFLKYRTPEDLKAKWEQEKRKLLYESSSVQSKLTNGLGLFNEMVPCTLHGARVSGFGMETPWSHLSDIQLGIGASCNRKDPSFNPGGSLSKLNKLPHLL